MYYATDEDNSGQNVWQKETQLLVSVRRNKLCVGNYCFSNTELSANCPPLFYNLAITSTILFSVDMVHIMQIQMSELGEFTPVYLQRLREAAE